MIKEFVSDLFNDIRFKVFYVLFQFDDFMNRYTFSKEVQPVKFSKVILPPELKVNPVLCSDEDILNKKFGKYILDFLNTIKEDFSAADLNNFYRNVTSLQTNIKHFARHNFWFNKSTLGRYSTRENQIEIDPNYMETVIYHELFHMASTVSKDDIYHSGFHQNSRKWGVGCLGVGINEGYTELLTKRYFPKNNVDSYKYNVFIAENLEKIIGKETMQSLYMNGNLYGLIMELMNYASEKEIMKFIASNDYMVEYFGKDKLKAVQKDALRLCIECNSMFLIACYASKLFSEYQDGQIESKEEFLYLFQKYLDSFGVSFVVGKTEYKMIPPMRKRKQVTELILNALDGDELERVR